MSKVLVLYYSSYGHLETMANAVAEGAREAGATVDIKRVPETVRPHLLQAQSRILQNIPLALVPYHLAVENYNVALSQAPASWLASRLRMRPVLALRLPARPQVHPTLGSGASGPSARPQRSPRCQALPVALLAGGAAVVVAGGPAPGAAGSSCQGPAARSGRRGGSRGRGAAAGPPGDVS